MPMKTLLNVVRTKDWSYSHLDMTHSDKTTTLIQCSFVSHE